MLTRLPIHPILFAAYATLFLYAENLSQVLLVDARAPLARAVLGAAAGLIVLGLVYRDGRRGGIVASALVIGFFGFGHAAALLADARFDDQVQLVGWAAIVVGAAVYAARARSVARATSVLNVVGLVLLLLAAGTILPYEIGRAGRVPSVATPGASGAATDLPTTDPPTVPARDIYFLVFDRYGSADAIERRFGITDNDLYGWLEERGFEVPADSRANYRATDFSLAATLNMRLLDELTKEIGRTSDDRTPSHELIRHHAVGRFLKAQGYRYYHLGSWYGPTASNPMADVNLSADSTSEFEAVLRDTTILPAIDRVLGVESPEPTFRDRHREASLFAFRQLHRVATAPGPKFVVAHVLLPHDPYVFRADGSPITEVEADATDEGPLYADHLEFVNAEIKSLVDDLLSGPDESDPIVIVQADEGPLVCRSVDCPTFDPEYLAVRFGILNGIYLPGLDGTLTDTFTPVNTFRTVFREYFGADLDPLPDRSFTWPDNEHIYDFRDITDELTAVTGAR